MNIRRLFPIGLALAIAMAILVTSLAAAGAPQGQGPADHGVLELISEQTGAVASYTDGEGCTFSPEFGVYLCMAPAPANPPQQNPAAHANALKMLATVGLLLMPESTNDRVMAFDPATGDLVDADFIPADAVNLSTPINAVASPNGDGFLVSDQIRDAVQLFDFSGVFVQTYAGGNTAILDNIRGVDIRPNGNLLVTVGSGSNANAVAEFDTSGTHIGNFIAIGSGGLGSPFDVYGRAGTDWLVAGINSDAIHRYDFDSGAYIANLTAVNNFPEQVSEAANGNVLVANFSGTEEGVLEYDSSGGFIGLYNPASLGGYRGVYDLPNGNILTTNGSGVHEIDRSGNLVETKVSGVSGRFIEYVYAGLEISHTLSTDGSCGADPTLSVGPGTEVWHCLTGINSGQFTLDTHTITDTILGPILTDEPYDLLPSSTFSLLITSTAGATGSYDYCSTWTASNDAMEVAETACATLTVEESTAITLDKTVGLDPGTCAATDNITIPPGGGGTEVTYCYTMMNAGSLTVTYHTLDDDQLGTLLGPDYMLQVPPGGSVSITETVLITETTVNVADWTIRDEPGGLVLATASDTATVTRGEPTGVSLSAFGPDNGQGWLPLLVALAILGGSALLLRRKAVR